MIIESFSVESFSEQKINEVMDLFYSSVQAIPNSIYSEQQKNAWVSTPASPTIASNNASNNTSNFSTWNNQLSERLKENKENKTYLALVENKVVGFTVIKTGYIDLLYTHPDFQRQGIASRLLGFISQKAKMKNIKRLSTDASMIAKPFFEKHNFRVIKKNTIKRGKVNLINFSMEKFL